MYPVESLFYGPALRGKAGELSALLELDDPCKKHILPTIIAPPISAGVGEKVDVEAEVLSQVARIADHWLSRPCLWDSRFVKFDNEDRGSDAASLSYLLKRLRDAGAQIIPIMEVDADVYKSTAIGGHVSRARSGLALRLTLQNLADTETLLAQIRNVGVHPSDCVLILDLFDASMANEQDFSQFLLANINKLKATANWSKIVFQASAFPFKNPSEKNSSARVKRLEWQIWQNVLKADPSVAGAAIFGDFGADHGRVDFSGGGKPIPHFRYATASEWVVQRGDANYQTIRSVAEKIVSATWYSGDTFSAGDEYIWAKARTTEGPGTATHWRSANMNHHMTLMIHALGGMAGVEIANVTARRKIVQEVLFPYAAPGVLSSKQETSASAALSPTASPSETAPPPRPAPRP